MTVHDFDSVTTGAVDYRIINPDGSHLESFTRDVLQEIEAYQINMIKFRKYQDARIIHVYTMNDIIRVVAKAETDR